MKTYDFPLTEEQIVMTETQIRRCDLFLTKFISGIWASLSDEKRLAGVNQYMKEKLRLEAILVELYEKSIG
jgi:hypothetical protein